MRRDEARQEKKEEEHGQGEGGEGTRSKTDREKETDTEEKMAAEQLIRIGAAPEWRDQRAV